MALFFSIHVSAHGQDSLCVKADSMAVKQVEGKKKRDLFHAIGHAFTKVFRGFNELDNNYIEPQHYDYTVMLQNTNTFEEYTIESKSGQRFSFAPDWSAKIGPYAAWRWLFLGYSFDVKHLEKSKLTVFSQFSSAFPRPITSILQSPLCNSPTKSVCSLTLLIGTIRSA